MMSPPDPMNVRFYPELGGGVLIDMGCYTVSASRMVMQAEPVSVRAWQKFDKRFNVDVAGGAIVEFPGERLATLSWSFEATGLGHYSVIGRKGVIEVPRALVLGLMDFVPEALIVTVDRKGARSEETLPANDHYQLIVEAFGDAVLNGTPVPLPLKDSIANARVLDAIALSAREGREVRL
jgi:predicted dehydrogenase